MTMRTDPKRWKNKTCCVVLIVPSLLLPFWPVRLPQSSTLKRHASATLTLARLNILQNLRRWCRSPSSLQNCTSSATPTSNARNHALPRQTKASPSVFCCITPRSVDLASWDPCVFVDVDFSWWGSSTSPSNRIFDPPRSVPQRASSPPSIVA